MTRHGKSLALVLRVFDYSETSQVVHLYARELGKIHGIAKGSKRPASKGTVSGPLDLLTAVPDLLPRLTRLVRILCD